MSWRGAEAGRGSLTAVDRPRRFPNASKAARSRYAQRRTATSRASTNDLTETQWSLIMEAWGGCAYCTSTTRALQKDCVLPVSRGGRYTLTNVVPACASCNASKHNGEVSSWMRRKGFDEPAFLLRWAEIVSHLT